MPAPKMVDVFSVFVARAYARGDIPFEDADTIMNAIFDVAVSTRFWAEHDRVVPPHMMEVYQAFDAGEYFHPGDEPDVNPESKYTKPLIADFLARQARDA